MFNLIVHEVDAEKAKIQARNIEMPDEKDNFSVLDININEMNINLYFNNSIDLFKFAVKVKEIAQKNLWND